MWLGHRRYRTESTFRGRVRCLEEVVHRLLFVFPSVCTVGVMSTVTVVVNSVRTRVPWTVIQELRVLQLCAAVLVSVRQTASSAFRVPKSRTTEAGVISPLTLASMQQKRGSKIIDEPRGDEEAASTVLLCLECPLVVETPSSSPGETVGRRVLGTDILYVESEKMAYNVFKKAGEWPVGRLKLVDVAVPRPVAPVKKKN